MQWYMYILVGLASMAAGLVNALAGGGTLIAFPAILAAGVATISANVTSTVSLVPGYLGATFAQRKDILEQKNRLFLFAPAGVVGGLIGGYLLLISGEKLFSFLVPFLILFASVMLALSDPMRKWVEKRISKGAATASWMAAAGVLPVGLAAIYGGYFGAGVSVIILAVLGLMINDSLTKLNALKQSISFSTNLAAAIYFLFSGKVVWDIAAIMAVCALIGGWLGGKLAGRVKPSTLRWMVVIIGLVIGTYYLLKQLIGF